MVILHESEFRVTDYSLYCFVQFCGFKSVLLDYWVQTVNKSRLTVRHVALCTNVQDAIVRKVNIALLEWVAVRFLYAAVGSKPKVNDTRLAYVSLSDILHEVVERKTFVKHCRCAESSAVRIGLIHRCQNLVRRRFNALWYETYYTHNEIVLEVNTCSRNALCVTAC